MGFNPPTHEAQHTAPVATNAAPHRLTLIIRNDDEDACLEAIKASSHEDLFDREWNGVSIMNEAARRGYPKVLAALLEKGLSPATSNQFKVLPLHEVAMRGCLECVKVLLAAPGMHHGLSNAWGVNPLHLAATRNRLDMVKYLLSIGADIEAQTAEGATALALAADSGAKEVVALLLEKGAKKDTKDKLGRTPKDRAGPNLPEIAALL